LREQNAPDYDRINLYKDRINLERRQADADIRGRLTFERLLSLSIPTPIAAATQAGAFNWRW
jgi:hypothetical protein